MESNISNNWINTGIYENKNSLNEAEKKAL